MTSARLSRISIDDLRRRRAARQAREVASSLPLGIEPITPIEQPIPSRDQPLEDANQGFFRQLTSALFTPLIPESAVDSLSSVPIIGKPLNLAGEVIQELSSPFDIGLTVATAGFGPAIAGGLKGAGFAGRAIGGLAAPVLKGGSFASRAAAETALGAGAVVGAEAGGRVLPDLPGPTEGIIGGLLGGGLTIAGLPTAQRILNRGVQGARRATPGVRTEDFKVSKDVDVTTPTYRILQPMFTDSEIDLNNDRLAALLTDGVDSPATLTGPLYSVMSKVGGVQRALDVNDPASVASLRHATREQQSTRLAAETSSDIVVRFGQAFRVVDGKLPDNTFEVTVSGPVTPQVASPPTGTAVARTTEARVSETGRPAEIDELIELGGGIRTEDFDIRPGVPATQKRIRDMRGDAQRDLGDTGIVKAIRNLATQIERRQQDGLRTYGDLTSSERARVEQLAKEFDDSTPLSEVARGIREESERLSALRQDRLRKLDEIELDAQLAAIERGKEIQSARPRRDATDIEGVTIEHPPHIKENIPEGTVKTTGQASQVSQVIEDAYDTGRLNPAFAREQSTRFPGRGREQREGLAVGTSPRGADTSLQLDDATMLARDISGKEGGRESLVALADGTFRNDRHGYVFTTEQLDIIDDIHKLMAEGWDYAVRNGIEIDKVALEGAGSVYFPRLVLRSMRKVVNEFRGRKPMGAEEAFEKMRTHIGQAIARGVSNGVDYDGDIGNILNVYLNGIYRSVRDQQLHDDIAALAVRRVDAPIIKSMRAIFAKLEKTGSISQKEIEKVRAVDPETARVIEEEILTIEDYIKTLPAGGGKIDITKQARAEATLNLKSRLFGGAGDEGGLLDPKPAIGEGSIESISGVKDPLFAGEIYDKRTADLINRQLQRTGNRFTQLAGEVGDAGRTAQASADFSGPFIQGIFLAAVRPDKFARGIGEMLQVWLKPEKHIQLIANNLDVLNRHKGLNIGLRNEQFAGIGPDGLLARALTQLGAPGNVVLNGLGRFDTAFTFFGDYARINLAKAYESIAEKELLRGNDRAFAELDSVINRMTGTFSPGELILSPTQEELERAFLFFAPRYTRACLALATDVFKGGLRGDVARDAMVRAALGGMLAYVAIAKGLQPITGEEPHLDPRPKFKGGDGGDFMAIKMPGSQDVVGIGSFWISFLRLTANVISDDALLGQGGVQDSSLLFQSTDAGGASVADRLSDNQVFQWLRSRSSVVSGTSWDIANGHDFVGNAIEPGPDWVKHIGQKSLPFALQNVILGQPSRPGAGAFAGEFFGLRSHPMSRSARRNQLRDRLSQMQHGKNWDDINKLQKERLETQNEELNTITEAARTDRVVRGREIDKQVDDYFSRRESIDKVWNDGVDLHVRTIQNDPARRGLPWLRKQLSELNAARRIAKKSLDDDKQFESVRQWLTDLPNRPGVSPEKPEDEAYSRYITEVLLAEGLDDPAGFDFEKQEQLRTSFRESVGDDVFGYIQARLDEGSGINPLIQEFFDGRARFQFYWGSPSDPSSIIGAAINSRANPEMARIEYRRWRDSSELERSNLEAESRSLSSLIKFISSIRLKARDKNPELDAFLFRWGFNPSMRNEENKFDDADRVARHPTSRGDYVLKQS